MYARITLILLTIANPLFAREPDRAQDPLDVTYDLKPGTNRIRVLLTSTSEGKPAFGPTTLRAFQQVIVE